MMPITSTDVDKLEIAINNARAMPETGGRDHTIASLEMIQQRYIEEVMSNLVGADIELLGRLQAL